jgi:hypothetical protein
MEEVLSRHSGKTTKMIFNLPEEPVTWVCYNDDMVPYYEQLICEIKGTEYFRKYVSVVSISATRSNSRIYLDPALHDLIGNGYE